MSARRQSSALFCGGCCNPGPVMSVMDDELGLATAPDARGERCWDDAAYCATGVAVADGESDRGGTAIPMLIGREGASDARNIPA